MKKADIVCLFDGVVSMGSGLVTQLYRHQLCGTAIAIPMDHANALKLLRQSDSDCVVFICPHATEDFIRKNHDELLALNKPLIGYVTEWIADNDVFPQGKAFHQEKDWFHYYAAAHNSDVKWFRSMGSKSDLTPLMLATDLFPSHSGNRIPELCYVGNNNPYKVERLRLLQILVNQNLIRVYAPPMNYEGANQVSMLFRSYAAIFCPQACGRGQSIRCYEAAASGALIVEAQILDEENEFFVDGIHRVAMPIDLAPDEICDFVRQLDYEKLAGIAKAGCDLVHTKFSAEAGFRSLLQRASQALTGSN